MTNEDLLTLFELDDNRPFIFKQEEWTYIMAHATSEQLKTNPYVKKLVEALEFIAKAHIGMSKIPVVKNSHAMRDRAIKALAEFGGENESN